MSLALVNIGDSHDGGMEGVPIAGDALIVDEGAIAWIGDSKDVTERDHQTVIDVAGATVTPGFIDSHVHTTFGDYTPRQQTIGFLESYLHGGTTRVISASEVHVPGRPTSVTGIKALAVAAAHCYADYRPAGMTVHGGSVILEPGLTPADFAELRKDGVWLAKAGFGAFSSPMDYVPLVNAAREAGITVMCHTGGGSIPGSLNKIGVDALLAMQPNIAGHVNGGPTALSSEENERIVTEGGSIALQLVHAGNLRSAIDIAGRALEHGVFHRVMIATDTPTGTGVIPLGMLRQMAEMSSLGPITARQAITASTGNVAEQYGLDAGRLIVGAPADLAVLDAPLGCTASTALAAIDQGDVPAVAVVITGGMVRFTKSRNTPGPIKPVAVRDGA
ncbi:amidohydrolase family protein [Saxibacter everestensis]|uniref:Amidohydrolase family protein n=1 Tax=Saxibacter everestensis TaxID=2909229 RepID=A0ABY8QU31_9MICO|nr:amidohydrolase family protein [Brevibacteriaceae bacterium ZFBP1038]